jgi:hypothetical protein
VTGEDLSDIPLDELEAELGRRANQRDAELVVNTFPDGRFRAAFKRFGDPIAPAGIVLLEAAAATKRTALERLLATDAEPPL